MDISTYVTLSIVVFLCAMQGTTAECLKHSDCPANNFCIYSRDDNTDDVCKPKGDLSVAEAVFLGADTIFKDILKTHMVNPAKMGRKKRDTNQPRNVNEAKHEYRKAIEKLLNKELGISF